MPSRTPIDEIIRRILTSLQEHSPQSLAELARNTDLNERTVRRYLELIQTIQKAPPLHWEQVGQTFVLSLQSDP